MRRTRARSASRDKERERENETQASIHARESRLRSLSRHRKTVASQTFFNGFFVIVAESPNGQRTAFFAATERDDDSYAARFAIGVRSTFLRRRRRKPDEEKERGLDSEFRNVRGPVQTALGPKRGYALPYKVAFRRIWVFGLLPNTIVASELSPALTGLNPFPKFRCCVSPSERY